MPARAGSLYLNSTLWVFNALAIATASAPSALNLRGTHIWWYGWPGWPVPVSFLCAPYISFEPGEGDSQSAGVWGRDVALFPSLFISLGVCIHMISNFCGGACGRLRRRVFDESPLAWNGFACALLRTCPWRPSYYGSLHYKKTLSKGRFRHKLRVLTMKIQGPLKIVRDQDAFRNKKMHSLHRGRGGLWAHHTAT